MATPQIIASEFRALCNTASRPLRLTGMLQMWLIQHFANATSIVEAGLSNRIWTNTDDTGILITPNTKWKPQTTEKRPQLVIKRNDLKHVRLGIDNRYMGSGGSVESCPTMYGTSMQGSHTVFCIAGEGAEAEQLGTEVALELMKFSSLVRSLLNFLRIELVDIGQVAKLEEASENFVVPVSIAYAFMHEWEVLALDDPMFNSIKLVFG